MVEHCCKTCNIAASCLKFCVKRWWSRPLLDTKLLLITRRRISPEGTRVQQKPEFESILRDANETSLRNLGMSSPTSANLQQIASILERSSATDGTSLGITRIMLITYVRKHILHYMYRSLWWERLVGWRAHPEFVDSLTTSSPVDVPSQWTAANDRGGLKHLQKLFLVDV